MSNTKFQFKRTTVSGRLPNTTNSANASYIDAGEFAVNLTDGKVVSSNGTVTFEIGANLSSLNLNGALTANGSNGSSGQVLTSNTTGVYWSTVSGGSGGVNTDAQYTWSNTQTFSANISLVGGTIANTPVYSTDIVNKSYADAIATGINFHQAAKLTTTVSFDSSSATYYNGPGANGVGATITDNAPYVAISLDGVAPVANDRILMKNSTNTAWNGVYAVTNTGSASYAWILTRATDYDQVGSGRNEIYKGDLIYITAGSTLAGTSWVENSDVTTIGTDPITFVQFSSKALYALSAGDGLYWSTGGAFDGSAASTIAVNTSYVATLTANNSTNLNGQPATYYTNATNITAGTLPWGRVPTGTVNTSGAFTFSNVITFSNTITTKLSVSNAYSESQASPTISAGTLALDLSSASVFAVNLNSSVSTLTITNIQASGNTSSFVLNLTADGTPRTVAWPSAFRWPSGTAPTITSTVNKTDVVVAYTYDSGTNWFAFTSGQNL